MTINQLPVRPEVQAFIEALNLSAIPRERQAVLGEMADYIRQKTEQQKVPLLHFICTHNSRRSQFGQVWCRVVGAFYGVDVATFSGGTEVTNVHPQVIKTLEQSGLKVKSSGKKNREFQVSFSQESAPIALFSKLYDHPDNPTADFVAVMTCSHADSNCPFIPGAAKRLALHYPDPKSADGTSNEAKVYAQCNRQIAAEMVGLFRTLQNHNQHV